MLKDNTKEYESAGFVRDAEKEDILVLKYEIYDGLTGTTKKRRVVVNKYDKFHETYEEFLREESQISYSKGMFRAARMIAHRLSTKWDALPLRTRDKIKDATKSLISEVFFDAAILGLTVKDNTGQRWVVSSKGTAKVGENEGQDDILELSAVNMEEDDEIGELEEGRDLVVEKTNMNSWSRFIRE